MPPLCLELSLCSTLFSCKLKTHTLPKQGTVHRLQDKPIWAGLGSGLTREACCRRVWQYAIAAVLQDAAHEPRWPAAGDLRGWQRQRRRYVALYRRRLEALRPGAAQRPDQACHCTGKSVTVFGVRSV